MGIYVYLFEPMTTQTNQVDFGKRSGLKVSPVSMGGMRFPEDHDQAVELIRKAIDANLVYIDTSRGYEDSEIKIGKALKDGYREKVILSTKWAPWVIKPEETDEPTTNCTYKRILESMERLQVEYLDFYQIWNICSEETWQQATQKGGMLDGIKRAMDEGLVKHTGFTTHDKLENVSRYIDEADWCEAILFTYNILNKSYQDVIAKAHDKGIATIIMNPTAGGLLAEFSTALQEATGHEDLVSLGHRYLAGDPNVDTVICGIGKESDIYSTIENFNKTPLTKEESIEVEKAMHTLRSEEVGFCTQCGYCQPCPQGINIPQVMHGVYLKKILQVPEFAKRHLKAVTDPNANFKPISECTKCSRCELRCTQKLQITKLLDYAQEILEESQA